MNDFESFMGFGADALEKAENESTNKGLTAGVYHLMIEKVVFMCRPAGAEAYAVDTPAQAGKDLCIEISTVLTEEMNGFAAGWKYTIYLRPMSENDIVARINKAQLSQLFKAANIAPSTDMANALVGKIIEIQLTETTSKKDGNTYVNIKEIRPVDSKPTVAARKTADNEPNWSNTKAAQPAAKPATKAAVPADWE